MLWILRFFYKFPLVFSEKKDYNAPEFRRRGMIVMWLEAHGTEPADLEDLIYENKTQVPSER